MLKTDFNSEYARKKYEELQNKKPENLTEKQKDFYVSMYLKEEYEAGLG